MKVLLATNVDELNEAIISYNGIELVCNPVYCREDVIEIAERTEPEVVVLTAWLAGNIDILDVIYQLRSLDIRVVFLADTLTPEDLTTKRILELGVDIIFGDFRIGEVLEKILSTSTNKLMMDEKTSNSKNTTTIIDEPEDWEEKKNPFSKIIKIGGDIKKNMPNIAMPKFSKRAIVHEKSLTKVLAVSSPVHAGKTFIAVNLAAAVAQEGYNVALVDMDYKKFGIHTWLNCPAGEEGLSSALQNTTDPMVYAYQPGYLTGLYVFTFDPSTEKTPLINDKDLILFLQTLQQCVDVVIVDTLGDFSTPITKTLINSAGMLVVVNDLDFSHLLSIQREIDNLPDDFDFDKCIIIANQLIESEKLSPDDVEKATGMKVSCSIPSRPCSILESIKAGIPAVMFDQEIKQAFEELVIKELAQAG